MTLPKAREEAVSALPDLSMDEYDYADTIDYYSIYLERVSQWVMGTRGPGGLCEDILRDDECAGDRRGHRPQCHSRVERRLDDGNRYTVDVCWSNTDNDSRPYANSYFNLGETELYTKDNSGTHAYRDDLAAWTPVTLRPACLLHGRPRTSRQNTRLGYGEHRLALSVRRIELEM